MSSFIPSSTPTEFESIAFIRQNASKKTTDILEIVCNSKKIHIPHLHNKTKYDSYNENSETMFSKPFHNNIYAKIAMDLPTGSIIIIPNVNKGLLVRIISSVNSGVIESLCCACSPRECGHSYVSSDCEMCQESIQEIFDSSNITILHKHMKNGNILEPFYTLYRDIEICGDVDYNGTDGRKIATVGSSGKMRQFWSLVLPELIE